jgi:hypothetical protein
LADPALAGGATAVAGTDQLITAQLLLGSAASATSTNVLQDFLSITDNLCLRYGTCCNTDLCNGTNKNSFNPFNLFLILASVFLAKFIF